ncbi:MAG: hypothetical protein WA058_01640 [Minisyncoccia bacterium]
MSTKKCNAPCIINASSGFHLVFCEGEPSHTGDHSLKIKDEDKNAEVVISWSYLGDGEGFGHVSYAPPLNGKRCENWSHIPRPPKLRPGSAEWQHSQYLLYIANPGSGNLGFCCEKDSPHDGEHVRSGVFGPLGITWEIVW